MKQWLPFLICTILAHVCAAQELGIRKVDVVTLPAQQWETDDGIGVETGKEGVLLSLKGKPFAAAAPKLRMTYDPSASITIATAAGQSGTLTIQIEWFDAADQFIEAVKAVETAELKSQQLRPADFLPKDKDRAKAFRPKLWLGGTDARVQFTQLELASVRQWREPNVRLLHAYDFNAKFDRDKGIRADQQGESLLLQLEPQTPYSAIALNDRVDYSAQAVVLFDVSSITQGTVTVQAQCWDTSGNMIKAVDLMKVIAAGGTYEVPLSLYAEQFTNGTRTLSFKIWLGGEPSAAAVIHGLYYGINEELK